MPSNPLPSPVPQWWLHSAGHVLMGAIVVRDYVSVEAQVVLDGTPIYRSRHPSRTVAEEELLAVHGQCTRDGWVSV